jgi:hypothetical protein
MGYYPPYVPDTYLQNMKHITMDRIMIKPVEAIQKKEINPHRLKQQTKYPRRYKGDMKGQFFDQYA